MTNCKEADHDWELRESVFDTKNDTAEHLWECKICSQRGKSYAAMRE